MNPSVIYVGECPVCNGDDIALVVVNGEIRGWCSECDTEYSPPHDRKDVPQPVAPEVESMRVGNWRFATPEEAATSKWASSSNS